MQCSLDPIIVSPKTAGGEMRPDLQLDFCQFISFGQVKTATTFLRCACSRAMNEEASAADAY
jgi:hypothetical protein